MSKKRFGISAAVNTALTQTIQMAEAENSNFFNTEILIDRISLDSENPRKQKSLSGHSGSTAGILVTRWKK